MQIQFMSYSYFCYVSFYSAGWCAFFSYRIFIFDMNFKKRILRQGGKVTSLQLSYGQEWLNHCFESLAEILIVQFHFTKS